MPGSLSLERGLQILTVLRTSPGPVGVRELSRRLGLSAAAVQRLVNSLARAGYVEQDVDTRKYRLGHALLALADRVAKDSRLLPVAQAELEQLATNDAFNGFLGVRRDGVAVYLGCVQSRSPVVIRATPGDTMHLHATALGKALLIDMPDEEIKALLDAPMLVPLTAHTVVDTAKLIAQIRTARSIGYTTAFNENIAGVVSVGAPIRDATGAIVAAISIAVARAIYPKIDIATVGEKVSAAAERISTRLGWPDPVEKKATDVA